MKTLLLVAHGSRMASSNDTVVELVEKLRPRLESVGFGSVAHAFLELTSPGILEGIQALVVEGATQIVILPYFLAPGTHVINDVPDIVQEARENHPFVSFEIMPHLGGVDGIVDLILESASTV